MLSRPAKTKKRCLPVHQLALVRTPTYDGLAPPVTPKNSNVPISKVNCATKKVHVSIAATQIELAKRSQRKYASRTVTSPFRNPDVCSSNLKPTRSAAQAQIVKSRPLALQSTAHQDFKAASDGFVGSELSINSVRMSARRKGPICKKVKKSKIMRELVLRRPAPMTTSMATVDTTESYAAKNLAQSSGLVESNDVFVSRKSQRQTKTGSTQFLKAAGHGANLRAHQRYSPHQLEKLISHKLASISAPVRRSESSESKCSVAPCSFCNEDECDGDDRATVSTDSFGCLD